MCSVMIICIVSLVIGVCLGWGLSILQLWVDGKLGKDGK